MEKFVKYLKSDTNVGNQFVHNIMKQNYENQEYWEEVIPLLLFSDPKVEKYVLENIEIFNLKYLIKYAHELTNKIIDYILLNINLLDDYNDLITYQRLIPQQILEFIEKIGIDKVNWKLLQEYQYLTQEFITKYQIYIDWDLISEYQFMDLKFLVVNKSKINWELVASNTQLQPIMNESFIKFFADTNIWDGIGYIENLDIDTINKYSEYLTPKSYKSIELARTLIEELSDS